MNGQYYTIISIRPANPIKRPPCVRGPGSIVVCIRLVIIRIVLPISVDPDPAVIGMLPMGLDPGLLAGAGITGRSIVGRRMVRSRPVRQRVRVPVMIAVVRAPVVVAVVIVIVVVIAGMVVVIVVVIVVWVIAVVLVVATGLLGRRIVIRIRRIVLLRSLVIILGRYGGIVIRIIGRGVTIGITITIRIAVPITKSKAQADP